MPAFVPVLVVVVLLAAFAVGGFWARYRVHEQVLGLIDAGDAEGAIKKIDGLVGRSTLSPLARETLRFQAIELTGDRRALAQQFNALMRMRLGDVERSQLLVTGFNAFSHLRDRKHAARILEEMGRAGFTDHALASYRRHFDYVLDHRTDGWRGLENRYAALSGKRRGYAAYLLFNVHKTLGDGEWARYRAEAARLSGVSEDELDRRINVNTTV